ncbi:dihydrodipicolinate synthase family protein [Kineococcus sp. SYSU DK002]|uniref:dihydrodipicolinate synthase family protein n=1 Tax=Kineococcus sp. SYSU DK002 TaxID=3383123 RepID=UPI003D7CE679
MPGPLSAFALTPLDGDAVDERGFTALVERIAAAGADSVGALGSTGSYAYFDRTQRARLARLAVAAAGDVPVLVGVGAVSTPEVLRVAEDAQRAGAAALLLAPVSYQPLTAEEVLGLYEDVTAEVSVPVCVYDNPATTGFTFTDELRAQVAALPGVTSLKLPGVPADPGAARAWVAGLRAAVPRHVTLGVAGDAHAVRGLRAGCDTWYSVIAGVLPRTCVALTAAVRDGDEEQVAAISARLEPWWALFAAHGSLRVVAALAEQSGLVARAGLPRPLRDLPAAGRRAVAGLLAAGGPGDGFDRG